MPEQSVNLNEFLAFTFQVFNYIQFCDYNFHYIIGTYECYLLASLSSRVLHEIAYEKCQKSASDAWQFLYDHRVNLHVHRYYTRHKLTVHR